MPSGRCWETPIKIKTLQQLGCGTTDESMGFRKRRNYTKTLKAEWFIKTENLVIQKLAKYFIYKTFEKPKI